MSGNTGRLIIGSSETSADFFYATSFYLPDPCVFLEWQGTKTLVLSDLELERGKKEACVEEVVSLTELLAKRKKGKREPPHLGEVAYALLQEKGCKKVKVAPTFPAAYAFFLKEQGVQVEIARGLLFPERLQKKEEEIEKMKKVIQVAEKAMRKALLLVRKAKIKKKLLYLEGEYLTSERLRREIELCCLEENALALHTIVASSKQAADPHEIGSGPLRAHEPLILDVFPRSLKSGYFADMTRTVVKGKPQPEVKAMAKAVLEAQRRAIEKIKDGVRASEVHREVLSTFEKEGFKTEKRNSCPVGFIHSTGHGIGLEVHEPPRLGNSADILKERMVVTVEPGLYYPEIGGARYEDMVLVRKDGAEVMTKVQKCVIVE